MLLNNYFISQSKDDDLLCINLSERLLHNTLISKKITGVSHSIIQLEKILANVLNHNLIQFLIAYDQSISFKITERSSKFKQYRSTGGGFKTHTELIGDVYNIDTYYRLQDSFGQLILESNCTDSYVLKKNGDKIIKSTNYLANPNEMLSKYIDERHLRIDNESLYNELIEKYYFVED